MEGLSQVEILIVAVLAGSFIHDSAVSLYSVKRDAERAGITSLGFNLGVRRLTAKGFVKTEDVWDEQSGELYDGLRLTEPGWLWVEANESKFVLHRATHEDDKLPI